MITWHDEVTLAAGEEVRWRDGRVRLRFVRAEPEPDRRWFAAWRLGRSPSRYLLQMSVTAAGELERMCWVPSSAPLRIATCLESGALLAPRRGTVFELRAVRDRAAAAVVAVGTLDEPSDDIEHGDRNALDPGARAFVAWWLTCSPAERWAGARLGALGHPALAGFGIQLMASSSGRLATTFHRVGDHYFVRTHGGCLTPVEIWYGPFVGRTGRFELG